MTRGRVRDVRPQSLGAHQGWQEQQWLPCFPFPSNSIHILPAMGMYHRSNHSNVSKPIWRSATHDEPAVLN